MKRSSVVGLASFLLVACLTSSASAMYHPRLGRFVSRDPIGYVGGMSLYAYVACGPADSADPSGLLLYIHDAPFTRPQVDRNAPPIPTSAWQYRIQIQAYLEALCPCYDYQCAPVVLGKEKWIRVTKANNPLKPEGSPRLCQCPMKHQKGCDLVEDAIGGSRRVFVQHRTGAMTVARQDAKSAHLFVDPWSPPRIRPWVGTRGNSGNYIPGGERLAWVPVSAASFGHEFVHVYYYAYRKPKGTLEQVTIGGTVRNMGWQAYEEMATVGSPLYTGRDPNMLRQNQVPSGVPIITENDLRKELGDPIVRLTYGSDLR